MINMENVRFENTSIAMGECLNAIKAHGFGELRGRELASAERLYKQAKEYMALHDAYNS